VNRPHHRPRQPRASIRMDACVETGQGWPLLQTSRSGFADRGGAVLRQVMRWGLVDTQEWTDAPSIPPRPHFVRMLVEPPWLQQVQEATVTHGVPMAAWLQHTMHKVTREDFPLSW
jgi:hypothetical protein